MTKGVVFYRMREDYFLLILFSDLLCLVSDFPKINSSE
jgi:hypothetical protein